jgi:hypothetical protein
VVDVIQRGPEFFDRRGGVERDADVPASCAAQRDRDGRDVVCDFDVIRQRSRRRP